MTDRFAHAYLNGDARVAAFVPHRYDSAEDRGRATARAAERSISSEVLQSLHLANERLGPSAARAAHLAALGRPGTVCVVTGQQVGLFLGPLYTVYKAAAAVATARALEEQTGRSAVPIFWLQSEDHDFDEVATTYLPHPQDPITLTGTSELEDGRKEVDPRVSMDHRRFGPDLNTVYDRLSGALGHLPFADETITQLRRHYRPNAGWVEAFAGLLAELFAPEGLLVFNPRAPYAAKLSAPVHRVAVEKATEIADRLQARSAALLEAGFSAPVHIRPRAPLCFFHPDGADGPRYRLAPCPEGWSVVGTERTIDRATVAATLDHDPRCFSTSALLRPVLQDSLLPTAAYVGGPGEIDYFAQIGPVYEGFDRPLPLLVPRARFAVVEPKVRKGLNELGLDLEALARPENTLLDHVAQRPDHLPDPETFAHRLTERIRAELNTLAPELDRLQPGLQKAAERTTESVERACSKFVDKYRAALNQSDTRRVDTVRRLKASLFPFDAPQERIFSLPHYAARYGPRPFIDRVMAECRPFNPHLEALEP